MWLKRGLALLVLTKIKEQFAHGLAKLLVLSILVELVANELELIGDAVGVATVLLAQKVIALVVKLVPFLVGSVLHDVSLLLKTLPNVSVHLLEPVLELWVLVSIAIDGVDGVEEVVERSAICEALNQRLERCQYMFVLAIGIYKNKPSCQLRQLSTVRSHVHLSRSLGFDRPGP